MARVAFGELKGDEVILTDADGAVWDETVPPDVVFLSRLDCEVTCLEIPPVPDHELPALIRYRIRSVYPGSLENAAIDQIVQRGRNGLVAIACIIDKNALEKYRRAAPKAALSVLCAALPSVPGLRRDGHVVHWCHRYVEVMRFNAGLLVESTLVKRTRHASDSTRIVKLLEGAPQALPAVLIAPEKETEQLLRQLSALAAQAPTGAALEARAVSSIIVSRRRMPSLFRPGRRLPAPRPMVVRSALAAAVILLAAGAFLRYLSFKERELAALHTVVLGSQESGQKLAELNARYDSLKSRVASLIQERPVDTFQFFADLRSVLGPEVYVRDIVVQNATFQFQAVGPSPLAYMRRFLSDSRFHDVRLLQTTPIPGTGRQQFIITGKYAK